MASSKTVDEQIRSNFEFLCKAIQPVSSGAQFAVDLTRIENIIDNRIPDTLKKNAPEDFYERYMEFKAEYDKFRDFILYDKLIGKNIVALGGAFSSGKSSFLNALMDGDKVLPTGIEPSTSVPTYIVKADVEYGEAINVFDAKVEVKREDFKMISHKFGEVEDEDDETVTGPVTLGHVLESIFWSTPRHLYENIAFLDTPGYSKADTGRSARTDEQIARGQLNSANYILWFVHAEAGTITEEDVRFIRTLREDIPKLIVVSKADKETLDDLKAIVAKIRETLHVKGVRHVDVLAFTGRPRQIGDEALAAYIAKDTERIRKQLEAWNAERYESSFARNFKVLFIRCREFYEKQIDQESRQLMRLNTSITRLMGESIPSEILEPLQLMVREAQKNVVELKSVNRQLKELQNEFFSEIKFVSDRVGIAMPEPSEIDLIQDKVQDPLSILEDYKKRKGIKTDETILSMLINAFDGIQPAFNKHAGGSDYRDELLRVLRESCTLRPEDIHINDVFKLYGEYRKAIRSLEV